MHPADPAPPCFLPVPPQSVRKGEEDFRTFRRMMAELLAEVHARGPPADDDPTIAAHLLRIRDPVTGRPLPDDRIAAEIGVFFTGGFETTGHTIAWVRSRPSPRMRCFAPPQNPCRACRRCS